MKEKYSVNEIVITALGMALVFVATLFIKIPNPIDGYFNLGDGFIMLFASILNPFCAFLVGGLGSALADVAGGYAYYFIWTLLIKGIEAFLIAQLFHRFGPKYKAGYYALGSVVMVAGYFFAKWFLKGSAVIALSGIPENIVQSVVGIVIAFVAYPIVRRALERTKHLSSVQ